MICIKIYFSLVFLATFASVFAGDCRELIEECSTENFLKYAAGWITCYENKICLGESKTPTDECLDCMRQESSKCTDEFSVCMNEECKLTEEEMKDADWKKDVRERWLSLLLENCGAAIEELQKMKKSS